MPKIPVELVGRYGQVHPTGNNSSIGRQDEIGAGINWYINGPAMALGAEAVYIARGFLLSLGCIQALECHSNECPTGIATQNKKLEKGFYGPMAT